MKGKPMKKGTSKLIEPQKAELEALAALPDGQINTQAIPEQRDWNSPQRGVFFRPVRQQITLRLDADLIFWFKTRIGDGYQASINNALREYIALHSRETQP
jgi:uncharacterized protein (DUF4415 family)